MTLLEAVVIMSVAGSFAKARKSVEAAKEEVKKKEGSSETPNDSEGR